MKFYKTKKFLLVCLSLIVIIISLLTVYIFRDRQMDVFNVAQYKSLPIKQSPNIKIGLIGDSWVSGKKLDQAIIDELKSSGINAQIVSIGHPGAKSKEIFRDLFSDNSSPYSSNSLLLDDDISFLVIVAGVNDAAGHIGKDFYAHHMKNIVLATNSRSKLPIIVELPEFGIETQTGNYPSIAKHYLYQLLFDDGKTDIISEYRSTLKTDLETSGLEYKLISFDPIARNYSDEINLYANPWHLNEEGCKRLGAYIGKCIVVENKD